MAYNEELLIQFMIDHYRQRFPNCTIVIYDNDSTDNTASIAVANGCVVRPYHTNNQIDDDKLRLLKNNCWKDAKTDWVLVCDMDELLEINEQDLKNEEAKGTTIIRSEAYNMVNMEDNFDIPNIKYGWRNSAYDKNYIFNKRYIREINYCHGAHSTNPIGITKYSDKKYTLYHYHYINIELSVQRHKLTMSRMSEKNIRNGWGVIHPDPEGDIRKIFIGHQENATKIRQ